MSKNNLIKLVKNGHIIGLHSHSHPTNFKKLNYEDQLKEYKKNYFKLDKIVKNKIKIEAMSHPCGSYNQSTLRILKSLGVKIGFRQIIFSKKHKEFSSLEIPRENHSNILNRIN